jgi:hypothetical protein
MRRKDKQKTKENIILSCMAFAVSSAMIAFSLHTKNYYALTLGLWSYGLSGIFSLLTVAQIFATYIRNQRKKQKKKDKIITNESK